MNVNVKRIRMLIMIINENDIKNNSYNHFSCL